MHPIISAYTLKNPFPRRIAMSAVQLLECNSLAVREAGRSITQLYDQFMAPLGLRSTQFSLLLRLKRLGPTRINALAAELAMDRSTLGRNILPLQRDGLIDVAPHAEDRRSKLLQLTPLGRERLAEARAQWVKAQTAFETAFGPERAAQLRELLRGVRQLSVTVD